MYNIDSRNANKTVNSRRHGTVQNCITSGSYKMQEFKKKTKIGY